MNKTELIARLARKQPRLTKKGVGLAVDSILTFIQDGLKPSNRIEIRGFGTFTLRHRPSRSRVNLKTGQKIISPTYYALHFKPAKDLRLRVNQSQQKTGKTKNMTHLLTPVVSNRAARKTGKRSAKSPCFYRFL